MTSPHSPRPFINAILIDLSGTLHVGDAPTPNAVRALRRLRSAGVPFRFCSNTSKESTAALHERLAQMGFEIESAGVRQEVWTSIGAVKQRLEDKGLKKPYFLLSNSAREECSSVVNPSADTPYDSVVVGLAPDLFTYDNLNSAFRILTGEHESQWSSLTKPEISLLATHKAKYIRSSDGALSLGPGPFVTALENASGLPAEVVGKPSRGFFETVIKNLFDSNEFNISEQGRAGRIAVIGDDVEADLGEGAVELGLWRILVRTGKYRPGDEVRQALQPPDEIHECLAAFIDDFLVCK